MRKCVPFLAFLALVALFFKLPEVPNFFGVLACKSCSAGNPFLLFLGAGYFSTLFALSLLFPSFPGKRVARGGLVFAIVLMLLLTYSIYPEFCGLCLFAHGCHAMIWAIWLAVPGMGIKGAFFRERICVLVFGPIAVVALFICLNLSFMAYGYKSRSQVVSLRHGDAVPNFTVKTAGGSELSSSDPAGFIINFVSPNCPFCKEQLTAVGAAMQQFKQRIINVSPQLSKDLVQYAPNADWVEDKGGDLLKLFRVAGFPTMFVVGSDGKIAQVMQGVPEEMKYSLNKP